MATEQRSRCPAHEDFDPLSEKFLTDPFAVLATLPLGEAPVFYAPTLDYYVVTRYADIEKVFLDIPFRVFIPNPDGLGLDAVRP